MAAIIFDFDGTIADSFEMMLEIGHELTGMPRYTEERVAYLRTLPLTKVLKELRIPLYRLPRLVLQGRQQMRARIAELHPFAGMPEAVRALHQSGHTIMLMSSNSQEGVESFLTAHDMGDCFDHVQGDIGLLNKAAALKKLMKAKGLSPSECIYVGDEVRDMQAAHKVGMGCISVSWGYQARQGLVDHGATSIVDAPADLPAMVAELAAA